MINLTRFTKDLDTIVPIIEGWGQTYGRKIYLPKLEDGWYRMKVGNNVSVLGKATPLEIYKMLAPLRSLRVYAYGEDGIPLNFDNFQQRGFSEAVRINFLNLQPFQLAKVVLWEDDRFYFFEADTRHERETVRRVREAFNAEQSITNLKYISPELRYYFLLLTMQRQQVRHIEEIEKMRISMEEKRKKMEEFRATFAGRLQTTVEQAGGSLVKFTKSRGNSYLVEWKLNGQTVKSQINDDLRIISAGFCLSGDDVKHTMASIVNLANMYQERSPLYITRE